MVELPDGRFILIDDAYNANPASVRAAIDVLGRTKVEGEGRRIAVLGDMLELGDQSQSLHADLAGPIEEAGIDLVFTCGHSMAALHQALPASRRGVHRDHADELLSDVLSAVKPGDCVLVKSSKGSRTSVIVEGLLTAGEPRKLAANGG